MGSGLGRAVAVGKGTLLNGQPAAFPEHGNLYGGGEKVVKLY